LNLDIEAIEESNKHMLLQDQNVQPTAKGAIPDHSVVNALNALNSLKNIGLEEAKSEEEEIQM